MNNVKLLITILLTVVNITHAMQEQSPITQMPPNVIRHITGFLEEKTDRNALVSACHYLHDTATRENKIVRVYRDNKNGTLPAEQFLTQVYTCIQHIVARNGNNSIELWLGSNHLSEGMAALSIFLKKCSQQPIVQHIRQIDLGENQLHSLPQAIAGLTNLKELALYQNALNRKDLVLLEKMINKSLKKLEIVDVRCTGPLTVHDVYQTIAHCRLKRILTHCKKEKDRFYVPTPEEVAACKTDAIQF